MEVVSGDTKAPSKYDKKTNLVRSRRVTCLQPHVQKTQGYNIVGTNAMPPKVKVFTVQHAHQADYKVFLVGQSHKEKNAQLISPGEFVKHVHQADVKVFIVNHEHQADIKILHKNFPKSK